MTLLTGEFCPSTIFVLASAPTLEVTAARRTCSHYHRIQKERGKWTENPHNKQSLAVCEESKQFIVRFFFFYVVDDFSFSGLVVLALAKSIHQLTHDGSFVGCATGGSPDLEKWKSNAGP